VTNRRAAVLGGLAGIVLGALAAWLVIDDRPIVDAAHVTDAVAREVGTSSVEPCRRRAPGRWTCTQWDPGQSGDARDYRVVLEGDGCWTATIVGSTHTTEGDLPGRVSGCL
jgi:hypothetical protein